MKHRLLSLLLLVVMPMSPVFLTGCAAGDQTMHNKNLPLIGAGLGALAGGLIDDGNRGRGAAWGAAGGAIATQGAQNAYIKRDEEEGRKITEERRRRASEQ